MTTRAPLSACQECGAALRSGDLLIEYERSTTGRTGYAECPTCGYVTNVSL